jgi:hypothetical protein
VSLSVFENEASSAVVGTIKASDPDQNDTLYYYIIGEWKLLKFMVKDASLTLEDSYMSMKQETHNITLFL